VRIAEIDLPVAPYEGDPLDWPAGAGDAFFVRLPGETAATLRAWLTARLGEKDRRYADFFLGHGLDMILKLAYCATMRRCTAMGIPPDPCSADCGRAIGAASDGSLARRTAMGESVAP